MTNKEAIEMLKPLRKTMVSQRSDTVFALDIAIKSLEAWDKEYTVQLYDDMFETWETGTMTLSEILDKWTEEGSPMWEVEK